MKDLDKTVFNDEEELSSSGAFVQYSDSLINSGRLLKDRFQLLEVIGFGGMGTVYKALDHRDIEVGDTKFLAIKVISPELRKNHTLVKSLHSETRKTQLLSHSNIVIVYDFDRDGDIVFMTMEYIDGISLHKVIEANSNGLEKERALKIVGQICDALIYAHSKNIIHLDLKPGNIFLDNDDNVKVFDFGIAKVVNHLSGKNSDADEFVSFTPSYASIEMIRGETADPRDDLYALACVTYELLTGQHPFNRKRIDDAYRQGLTFKKIKMLNSKQWGGLSKALARNRNERPESIRKFQQILEAKSQRNIYFLICLIGTASVLLFLNDGKIDFEQDVSTIVELENNTNLGAKPNISATIEELLAKQNQVPEEIEKTEKGYILETGQYIKLWTDKERYQIGDSLNVKFSVERPMYIKIFLVNYENEEELLFPFFGQKESYCESGKIYQVPPEGADFSLIVGGPIGRDRIIAISSLLPIPKEIQTINDLEQEVYSDLTVTSISYDILGLTNEQ